MKIDIHAVRFSLASPDRAYVEYRMFSAIGRLAPDGARLSIRLEQDTRPNAAAAFRCAAVLNLMPAARIRASATRERLYGAVDAAAERLARGVARRGLEGVEALSPRSDWKGTEAQEPPDPNESRR